MLHRLFSDLAQVNSTEALALILSPRLDKYLTAPVRVGDAVSLGEGVEVELQPPDAHPPADQSTGA
jgi:hypothetical protein